MYPLHFEGLFSHTRDKGETDFNLPSCFDKIENERVKLF